ncbi:hypothetical protein KJ780_00915, partial [Candidatus Micrarchaeota archaeon]|nr:hypothetical protein [Candidatus Micrarchaeota archaeon]
IISKTLEKLLKVNSDMAANSLQPAFFKVLVNQPSCSSASFGKNISIIPNNHDVFRFLLPALKAIGKFLESQASFYHLGGGFKDKIQRSVLANGAVQLYPYVSLSIRNHDAEPITLARNIELESLFLSTLLPTEREELSSTIGMFASDNQYRFDDFSMRFIPSIMNRFLLFLYNQGALKRFEESKIQKASNRELVEQAQ